MGHSRCITGWVLGVAWLVAAVAMPAEADQRFSSREVFDIEWVSDPQLSPDGSQIVYVRNFMDIMADRRRSNLWIIGTDGSDPRPLVTGPVNAASPRWSPDGTRLAYISNEDETSQLYLRWMDRGQVTKLAQLEHAPRDLAWSPDGRWLAFFSRVADSPKPMVEPPDKPEGAEWAAPPIVIDRLIYRSDGQGYLKPGFQHLFVLPADGGTPRQLTQGSFNHQGPATWAEPDTLVFAANRHANWELDPVNSEIYTVSLATGQLSALTRRQGPDRNPVVSPDGNRVAYLGFDDRYEGYQVTRLYVMQRDGSGVQQLSASLDRDVRAPRWDPAGRGLYFLYDDQGNTKLAYVTLGGQMRTLAENVGGTSLGRPYASGSFSVASDGSFAFTGTRPQYPADLFASRAGAQPQRLTRLNDDLFGHKELGVTEELWFESSHDQRRVQAWIVKPPGFDPQVKYPLVLEIHGGPFANYGDRFAAEVQLYAAAGYVVLYVNPRGSTSYGKEFGNLIHHNYPGEDYDDLMSGVDAVVALGYVDPNQLYVTGGSGGGVLTNWIVGKNSRFRAAVVAKPVINWYSFALTADNYNYYYRYWFPGYPWEHLAQYMQRSPISLVGNVTTPTMVLTGEQDYRTPISESEQYYQALKLRQVDAALVRLPGASHGIARRPSQLMAKVDYILAWFERYRPQPTAGAAD